MIAPPPIGGVTVKVISLAVDTDGDPTSETVLATVPGCSVQPQDATEDNDQRDQSRSGFVVIGPDHSTTLAVARSQHLLEVPGWTVGAVTTTARLAMSGNAMTWPDETGAAHHVEIENAYRVTG